MRKASSLLILSLLLSFRLSASTRHQSYFTYDDGGTLVRGSDGSSEVSGRVNLPVFPGDQIETGRRGRSELRLADGNVIALDRSTSLLLRSVLNDYDNENDRETVAELRSGQVLVTAFSSERSRFRLDTPKASYLPGRDTVFVVDVYSSTVEEVSVHEGTLEVRTPDGATRLRAGEASKLDRRGLLDTYTLASSVTGDFERWALQRSDRFSNRTSRYLDRSLAYADRDLDGYGSWVYAGDYGSWAWRPRVSVGWRPYHYGSWTRSRRGHLVWVSDEPWGWAPYHYGRWTHSPGYGWVWLPGVTYAPAWVYWAFGPSYVGWAPAGWYDCYRPYYNWAYRPYARGGQFGPGFYGHVRLSGVDLRPWTFVTPPVLVSNRVDRSALTVDAIRNRLSRDGDRAAISNTPIRISTSELKDPQAAVSRLSRRGFGGGTGKEGSGNSSDLTPFFRRDPELSTSLRDRIARAPGAAINGTTPTRTEPSTVSGGLGRGRSPGNSPAAGEPGVIRRDRGGEGSDPVAALPASRNQPRTSRETSPPTTIDLDGKGRINRGSLSRDDADRPATGAAEQAPASGEWRRRGGAIRRGGNETPAEAPKEAPGMTPSQTWREHGALRRKGAGSTTRPTQSEPQRPEIESDPDTSERAWRRREVPSASDVPRRIIDQIGGARVSRSEGSEERRPVLSSGDERVQRESAPSPPPQRVERPSESPRQESAPRENRSDDASPKGNIKRD